MPLLLPFLAWGKKAAQTVDHVPEVQIVPGEEAGGEIGLANNGIYVLPSKVAGREFSVRLLQDGDTGRQGVGGQKLKGWDKMWYIYLYHSI